MRKRTPSEIKAYGDGYAEAYKQFQYLIEKHEISTAVRKMKIFADAVALTVETATDTADTPQRESTGSPIGDYRDGVGAWQTDCHRHNIKLEDGTLIRECIGCPEMGCPWK